MHIMVALAIACILHNSAQHVSAHAKDDKTIKKYEFSVLVNAPGKKQIQTAVHMWLCKSPQFYIEEILPGEIKRMCYYDGKFLYTCMGNDTMKTQFSKHDLSKLPAIIDKHFVAFHYSTKVISTISLDSEKNGVYKHCSNVNVTFTDSYETQNEGDYIKHKSKNVTYAFTKSTGMVRFIKYAKDGKHVDVIYEYERDMLGMNSDYIIRLGRETFGADVATSTLFQDDTKLLMEYAQSLAK